MKINRIKYRNYRCFLDAEVVFETTSSRNIALLVGPNGSGKTEMLFSFWWVLYDFDFSKLSGKTQTPYSLNSALHQTLANSKNNMSETCQVELDFEENGILYKMKRSETFFQKGGKITTEQYVELSYKENNIKVLPITDPKKVEKILLRVIPQNVLHGIIFDGERMKQLSSITTDAQIAVEAVIKEITNEELFTLIRGDLESIKSDFRTEFSKLGKKQNNARFEQIQSTIQTFEDEIKTVNIELEAINKSIEENSKEQGEIHRKLEELKEVRQYEQERARLTKELTKKEQELKVAVDTFYKDLSEGYLLDVSNLVSTVQNNLSEVDIPAGLTVEAVQSIMKRTHCICGTELTQEIRDTLKELLHTLPPDNINSTISEMARQMDMAVSGANDKISRSYEDIRTIEASIKDTKESIAQISSQITSSSSESATGLETRNTELKDLIAEASVRKRQLEEEISSHSKKLETYKRQRSQVSQASEAILRLNEKDAFVDKCIKLIKAIDEYNKQQSLLEINANINDAYSALSEDAVRERKLYVVQFDKKRKYMLISYYENNFKRMKTEWLNKGEYVARSATGKSDAQIDEEIKIKVAEPNSTGQSKVNSLAFAKSILDFSSKERVDESISRTKNYPFIIDSPFTELSDENLTKPAQNIHEFSEQIILMISSESLRGVNEFIDPYVGSRALFEKNENEGYSTIKTL